MNKLFTTIVALFRSLFGIEPEEKTDQEIETDFYDRDLSIAATIAERVASLTLSESTITVVGDSASAKYLNTFAKWINDNKLYAIAQTTLGTGDCLARPNTYGKRIGLDIIPNKDFVIVDAIGDFLYSVLIRCDVLKKANDTYERWEYHKLNYFEDASYVTITQIATKNGRKIALTEVAAWANFSENQVIPNVDRLLFGRFKCPKLNREDVNSSNGVPITYGNEYIVQQAKDALLRFNDEFQRSEKFLFADKRVFKVKKEKDAQGNVREYSTLPQGKEAVIKTVNGSTQVDGSPLMFEFNPSIRSGELEVGIERNFRMLELMCGLSEGILSKSTLTYTNTDEVRKSTQATFAFISNFRKVLETGLDDLLYAVNVICNFNLLTPMGNYAVNYDWSDSFVQSMAERFNELLQSLNMGAISTAEFRAWVMSEDLALAEEQLKKIENTDIEKQDKNEAGDFE